MNSKTESEGSAVSVGTGAVPADYGVNPPMKKFRRRDFMNCAVFEVDSETYKSCLQTHKSKADRFSRYIKDESLLGEVREFAKKNPAKSILLYGENSDSFVLLKKSKIGFMK